MNVGEIVQLADFGLAIRVSENETHGNEKTTADGEVMIILQ
jgi:hypothetical protein